MRREKLDRSAGQAGIGRTLYDDDDNDFVSILDNKIKLKNNKEFYQYID